MAQTDNKTVLLVDDEEVFLRTVADGFALFADQVTLLTAPNGKVAVDVLLGRRADTARPDCRATSAMSRSGGLSLDLESTSSCMLYPWSQRRWTSEHRVAESKHGCGTAPRARHGSRCRT